jgi:hypothetical protein
MPLTLPVCALHADRRAVCSRPDGYPAFLRFEGRNEKIRCHLVDDERFFHIARRIRSLRYVRAANRFFQGVYHQAHFSTRSAIDYQRTHCPAKDVTEGMAALIIRQDS